MAGAKAKYGIWISQEFTDDHISALKYINEISKNNDEDGISLFGLKVSLKKIENSKPALILEIITKPDKWQRESEDKKAIVRVDFWSKLIDKSGSINPNFKTLEPPASPYLSIPSNQSGISYYWTFRQAPWRFQIELDISDKVKYSKLIQIIKDNEVAINNELGFDINIEDNEDTNFQRMSYSDAISIKNKPITRLSIEEKNELIEWGIKHMNKFYNVMNRYINKAK